ncbi:MAG: hydrogenase expression/formation protein, partial [Candidatus Thiodiazotropha sp. (ex Lucinoma borealis)]|nr:hydrogenase expression/formation protein [Candidatus Thiodiazotropha sp. (ex Lucinoma borealis)]
YFSYFPQIIGLDISFKSCTICETLYPGVWLIDHYNAEGERIALNVEINRVPEIVQSQPEDISDAIIRLNGQLNPENFAC